MSNAFRLFLVNTVYTLLQLKTDFLRHLHTHLYFTINGSTKLKKVQKHTSTYPYLTLVPLPYWGPGGLLDATRKRLMECY